MPDLTLNEQLQNDTHRLGQFEDAILLLHKNALFPWLILVPDTTETEFHRLAPTLQTSILKRINQLSTFIETHFPCDKLNIAAIGNIVSQMHIHVIGRRKNDAAWPDVVWGFDKSDVYARSKVDEVRNLLQQEFGEEFRAT